MSFQIPENTTHVIATDECGYGSLAGPLCIGVVCVPRAWVPPQGLTDSKALSWSELTRLAAEFEARPEEGINGTVYVYEHDVIDRMGVGKLLRWAHETAIENMVAWCRDELKGQPFAVVDGNMKIAGAVSLVKADLHVPACSMASVLAKVRHDKIMAEMDKLYPGYDFANSVGYSSPLHIAGLEKLGPCEIHRKSYSTYNQYKKDDDEPSNMWEIFDEE